ASARPLPPSQAQARRPRRARRRARPRSARRRRRPAASGRRQRGVESRGSHRVAAAARRARRGVLRAAAVRRRPRRSRAEGAVSTRYLLLAEGFSGDPHYGKTMRGVLRYRRDDVVAVLDSTRAGQTENGVPVVGSVADSLALGPTTALVGVATQGGRFPPEWIELLRACIEHGPRGE